MCFHEKITWQNFLSEKLSAHLVLESTLRDHLLAKITCVGIAIGDKGGDERRMVKLDQLVCAIYTDDRLVLLQS